MSLIVFQHHPRETASLIGAVMQNHGHRLRYVQVHAGEPVPPDLDEVDGVISMGGPQNVDQTDEHAWLGDEMAYLKAAHDAGLPIIGICLGAQLLAAALGGKVEPMDALEVGWGEVTLAFPGTIDPLYAGITWKSMQFHMHGRQITQLPPGAAPLASSAQCRTQAFKAGYRSYGFQYHFEWDRKQLEHFAHGDLVRKAGANSDEIVRQIDQHYDGYRRRAERLCERMALMLMPIEQR
jgi:GMP synthase-like glutamine amidotransferase